MPVSCMIVELDLDRVIADRLDVHDADMTPAGERHFLTGAVALDLGRRAFHAQKLRRQTKAVTVIEGDGEHLFLAVDPDFRRPGGILLRSPPSGLAPTLRFDGVRDRLVLAERARFVHEHDGDAVPDRIGEARLLADQLLAHAIVAQRRLGQRADQDIQKLGIDRRGRRWLVFMGRECRSCHGPGSKTPSSRRDVSGARCNCRRGSCPFSTRRSRCRRARPNRGFPAKPAFPRARTGRSWRARSKGPKAVRARSGPSRH